MANNRMRFVCDDVKCAKASFPLVKYYPSQGWYINRGWWGLLRFGFDLNRWLDQHKHGGMWGNHVRVEVDVDGR